MQSTILSKTENWNFCNRLFFSQPLLSSLSLIQDTKVLIFLYCLIGHKITANKIHGKKSVKQNCRYQAESLSILSTFYLTFALKDMSDEVFVTKSNFRQYCSEKFCPITYSEPYKIMLLKIFLATEKENQFPWKWNPVKEILLIALEHGSDLNFLAFKELKTLKF